MRGRAWWLGVVAACTPAPVPSESAAPPIGGAPTSAVEVAPAPKMTAMPVLSPAPVEVGPQRVVEHGGGGDTRLASWRFAAIDGRSGKARFAVRYLGEQPATAMDVVLYYYGASGGEPVWNDGTLEAHAAFEHGEEVTVELDLIADKLPSGGHLEAESYEVSLADGSTWANRNLYDSDRPAGGESHEQLLARRGEKVTGELVKGVDGWRVRLTNTTDRAIRALYPKVAFCDEAGEEVAFETWSSERQGPGAILPAKGTIEQELLFDMPKPAWARHVVAVPHVTFEDGSEWRNENLGHRKTMCR